MMDQEIESSRKNIITAQLKLMAISTILILLPISIHASCADFLNKVSQEKKYLFLKDAHLKRQGLFFSHIKSKEENSKIKKLFQFIPNTASYLLTGKYHNFTPIKGIYDIIYDLPFRYIGQRVSQKELIPRLYITIPVSITASIYTYTKFIDPMYMEKVNSDIDLKVKQHSTELNQLILYDYRFISIKESNNNDEVISHESRVLAFWHQLALKEYFNFIALVQLDIQSLTPYKKRIRLDSLNRDVFSKHVLFSGINRLRNNFIPQHHNDFYISKNSKGKISKDKLDLLYKNHHALLLKSEMVSNFFSNNSPKNLREHLFKNNFYQKLNTLENNKNILKSLIQEHIFWVSEFNKWEILGIKKYLLDEDGKKTDHFLSLFHIEQEIFADFK